MDFAILTQSSSCSCFRFKLHCGNTSIKLLPTSAVPLSSSPHHLQRGCVVRNAFGKNRNPESLFCYDKAIPEEIIEKPVGISLSQKNVGDNTRCPECEAKGAVLCATCSGSGLYVDSIMESQGIIVKIRCLGCGGTGNIMCSKCGGRGHIGCPNFLNNIKRNLGSLAFNPHGGILNFLVVSAAVLLFVVELYSAENQPASQLQNWWMILFCDLLCHFYAGLGWSYPCGM